MKFPSLVPRILRFFSTRLLERGFIKHSVRLERTIYKLRGDEVALRRLVRYGYDDAMRLLKEEIDIHGAEHVDNQIRSFLNGGRSVLNSVVFSPKPEDQCSIDLLHKLEDSIRKIFGENKLAQHSIRSINQLAFFLFKDSRPDLALSYGIETYKYKQSNVMSRYVANAFFRSGSISSALKWFKLHSEFNRTKILQYNSLEQLRLFGFRDYPEVINCFNNITKSNRVVYLLHNSLPYFSGGYATRSNGVIGGIKRNGWDISAVSRLGFPNDTKKGPARNNAETIDGIEYSLLIDDEFDVYRTPLKEYLIAYGEALYEMLKDEPPAIIHAASFFMNGIAAVYAAKKLGSKTVYEVRGLNELSKMSDQPHWEGSEHYQMMVRMETQAALDADKVFTLTQALKDEFILRGVEAEKITVLPNGVHSSRFSPLSPSKRLSKKLALKNEIVIGFVGSFVDYEGLDLLLKAVSSIKGKTKSPFKVLMVGDGACHAETVNLSRKLRLSDIVKFTGRVPHHEVEEYYSVIDICPFPRKGLPVCEMVSPLKPFEAMAMEKAVLASNVDALAEIVTDNQTGLLFQKDDVESLSEKLMLLLESPDLRQKLGVAARQWVIKERDWSTIAGRANSVYNDLLN